MLFNSVQFLIFFTLVTTVYFLLPHKLRWPMLLLASAYFYMCFVPKYIFILGFTILVDYFAGRLIERTQGQARKIALIASIIVNVGVLFFFKYFNFFNANVAELAQFLHWNYSIKGLEILLPIGLSFHTFQSMSYTIEVYRDKVPAERNLGIFALYVMFYPQLVAGPIERPQNLLPQFHEEHKYEFERVADGLKLMLWGFFKKIVIADRLALIVNQIYGAPEHFTGWPLLMATVFFAFQIFCDFSGYTDIARGAAQVMGFNLMKNFDHPYSARSISDFWQRWHISLTTWFKDYVYIPLGGNRVGKWRNIFNILVVFILSGLWHGANWTYVLWGTLNGMYLILGNFTSALRAKVTSTLRLNTFPHFQILWQRLITFALVCVGWIFFRSTDIKQAWFILTHLVTQTNLEKYFWINNRTEILIGIGSIIFLILIHSWQNKVGSIRTWLNTKPTLVRLSVYALVVFLLILLGEFKSQQFIYFQF